MPAECRAQWPFLGRGAKSTRVPGCGRCRYQAEARKDRVDWQADHMAGQKSQRAASRRLSLVIWTGSALAVVFCSSPKALSAPKWVEGYGDVPALPTCEAAPEVEILLREEEVKIQRENRSEIRIRHLLRVLRDNGGPEAQFSEAVDRSRHLKKFKGWRIRPGERDRVLTKKDLFEGNLTNTPGYYEDIRHVGGGFQDAVPGDLIAYEYALSLEGWGVPFSSSLVQSRAPVLESRISISLPEAWNLDSAVSGMASVEARRHKQTWTWTFNDLGCLQAEAMDRGDGLRPKYLHALAYDPNSSEGVKDWRTLSAWMAALHRERTQPTAAIQELTNGLLADAVTPFDTVSVIGAFVRDEVRYVALEVGIGRIQPRKPDATYASRYGDCKDKSALMVAMLQATGLEARTVLANVQRGPTLGVAHISNFDHCIVGFRPGSGDLRLAPATREGWTYFDPTDNSTAVGAIPRALQGTDALVCDPLGSDLVELPLAAPATFMSRLEWVGDLSLGKGARARVRQVSFGNRAQYARYLLRSQAISGLKDLWGKHLSNQWPGVEVDSLRVSDQGDSVITDFVVGGPSLLREVGNSWLLKPHVMGPWKRRLVEEERRTPIYFGAPQVEEFRYRWRVPEGWEPDESLADFRAESIATMVDSKATWEAPWLTLIVRTTTTGECIAAVDYLRAQAMERDLLAVGSQTIVLGRKP